MSEATTVQTAAPATGNAPNDARCTAANLSYSDETEHDLRVRTRLAELAAERGMTAEALLTELNAKLAAGQSLLPADRTPPVSRALPVPAPRSPSVLAERPADDVWGVVTLAHDVPTAPRRPCGGTEPCPWRRDAPSGQFPATAFELSAPTSQPGSTRRFGCHSSTPARPQVCAGWLLRGADGNERVQNLLASGRIVSPELPDGVELYDSYAEMAIANGVDPAHPALHGRPADVGNFVPLTTLSDGYPDQPSSTAAHTKPQTP
ncbi:DUF6283 family protein [Streptomyces lydicus]|uniref:DUF6283 family protein n=1 Tax=Streptomyces lydicus TaxID=47763 RepID=UPI0010106F59|nr:DUF6283 family protein [Streptomyces lydicus]MCZ1011921.1 DUF6283 family protein [Streptomyces lydicus]